MTLCGSLLFARPAAQPVDPSKGLVLANDHVRFEFEPQGMGLSAMIDRRSGTDHIRPVSGKHLLWEVAFGKGTLVRRITNNYKPCNSARIEELPGGGQRAWMEWNDLRWWLEDGVVTVHVAVDLPAASGVARWRIFVENRSDYWGLWSVAYPLVNGFPASGAYDIARPTFGSGGHLLKRWTEKIEGRYPSGNWPMQFLSLNRDKDAVYFASMDSEGRAKDFIVEPGERLAMVHYVENMGVAGSDYPDYYPVALGVYQGGWLEAAQRYRPWALEQKWASAGRISQRPEMADIIKDVGLWVRDGWLWDKAEGAPSQMNAPFLEAGKRMDVPMAIHWYNWHQTAFDQQYPHFLPAKPGFSERVRQLVDAGLLVMPYINGTSADMNIPDFSRFAPHAIVDEAGGYRMHFYSDAAGRLLSMCPTQAVWQDTVSKLVDELFKSQGVNGVYIDQISAMRHELCFHKRHGHPLGGGRYWVDGNRELLRKVRGVSHRGGRQAVITSEGADEVFFDLLDANLTWAEPTDWEIPLMQVVYSGYTLFFGSPCDYTKSDRFFNFAQGQAFIDGRQNGWIDFGLFRPVHAGKAAYFRLCGKYRIAAKKFVTYGQLLGPVEPANTVPTFTEDYFGWQTKHRGTVPSAEARLWRSEDGHLGVFLANYVETPVSFSYKIDPAQYRLEGGRYRLWELTPEGAVSLGAVSGTVIRTEELGPQKIKVIEIGR
ncbi:MAG: DUF6259 domain-containing protein [Acidobacteriota bacterium]